MATIHHNKVEPCAVGIETDGGTGMAFGPILHELAILHDDVVTAADELIHLDVLGAIVEREPETDGHRVALVQGLSIVGIGALEPQDGFAVRNRHRALGINDSLDNALFSTIGCPAEGFARRFQDNHLA